MLARYAFLHEMNTSFMLNTFWAAEHLVLPILIFKYKTKEELSKNFNYHNITKYWAAAKDVVSEEAAQRMDGFDNYIGKVQGYFAKRYP